MGTPQLHVPGADAIGAQCRCALGHLVTRSDSLRTAHGQARVRRRRADRGDRGSAHATHSAGQTAATGGSSSAPTRSSRAAWTRTPTRGSRPWRSSCTRPLPSDRREQRVSQERGEAWSEGGSSEGPRHRSRDLRFRSSRPKRMRRTPRAAVHSHPTHVAWGTAPASGGFGAGAQATRVAARVDCGGRRK